MVQISLTLPLCNSVTFLQKNLELGIWNLELYIIHHELPEPRITVRIRRGRCSNPVAPLFQTAFQRRGFSLDQAPGNDENGSNPPSQVETDSVTHPQNTHHNTHYFSFCTAGAEKRVQEECTNRGGDHHRLLSKHAVYRQRGTPL